MSGADQPRFVIRTTQGIHGPFSGRQIHGLVQQGQLKPNIRLFDQVTNAPVLVAQILRAIEDPAAPLPTGSGGEFPSVPQSAGPALAPDRTADDGSEIIPAEDLDLGDLDAEVAEVDIDPDEVAPAAPSRGSGRRRPPSSRRSTLSEDRPPPRRRSRYGSRDDYDRFDDDDYDDDDFDDEDDGPQRPRMSPRKRRRLTLALMLSGFSLIIIVIIVIVLFFGPKRPYGNAAELPGIWHVDFATMIDAGQRPPEYGAAELRVTHDTITMPDGKQAKYDIRIIKNGTAMSIDLTSAEGPQGQYEAHFEKRLVGEPTLWLQYPHKWIAFAPGPWPADPRAALYEIRESVGAQRFDGLTGGVDAILRQDGATNTGNGDATTP